MLSYCGSSCPRPQINLNVLYFVGENNDPIGDRTAFNQAEEIYSKCEDPRYQLHVGHNRRRCQRGLTWTHGVWTGSAPRCETWIGEHRQCAVSEFKASLSGYDVYQRPRANRKGGGVALIIRSDYKVKKMNSGLFKSFEHVDLTVKVNDVTTRIALIYRPPPSRTNGCKTADFLVEFASFLEVLVIAPGRLIILGDFNIHVDNATNGDALKFHDLLCSMNLVQLVRGSTHASGHTLDLVITRSIESPICTISDVTNDNSLPSDHSLINFTTPRDKNYTCYTEHSIYQK
ncbi:hypothetical protein BSL78_19117 [Apostichopus japonicus]|uniref:Sushi domain-containing protein n=1 Tax=Stichopus japonicus TaxID=307972 RepID=A0A2G8K7Q2_STIJA|nr:hypothetical protein BSL78_19117 [Apostichopus japonicus]